MFKYSFILFNLVGIVLFSLMLTDIKVEVTGQKEVEAGNTFQIEVTINKSDLESFARYQMEFPIGFTAKAIKTEGADFSFKDQKAKFLWLRLPSADEFTVTMEVEVDPTVDGYHFLYSTF